jgi:hypothetical protein
MAAGPPHLSICGRSGSGSVAAGCTSEDVCFKEPIFENLWSERIAIWVVNQSLWTHGCSYSLRLESGTFQTVAEPKKAVNGAEWSFLYLAFLPTLTAARKIRCDGDTCDATILNIELRWDKAVKCKCRTDVGLPKQPRNFTYSMEHIMKANEDHIVTLENLRPGSSHTVECIASLEMDPSAQSDWLTAGLFLTEPDTNAQLKDLRAFARPVCPGKDLDFVPMQMQGDRKQIFLTSADYYTACGGRTRTSASWEVQVEAEPESSYANVTVSWESDDGNESMQVPGLPQRGLLELDARQAAASMVARIEVKAAAKTKIYFLAVLSVRLELDVNLTHTSLDRMEARNQASAGAFNVQEGDRLAVQLRGRNMDLSQIPDNLLERMEVAIGPFKQVTIVDISAKPSYPKLIVETARGIGQSLQVDVLLDGVSLCSASPLLTFPAPQICKISTDGFQGCPSSSTRRLESSLALNDQVGISAVGCTTLYLEASRYRGFGGQSDSLSQGALPLQILVVSGSVPSNGTECTDSKIYSSTRLTCTFCPKEAPPLSISIAVPTGNGSTTEVLPSGGSDGEPAFEVPYKEPTVYGVSPGLLPIFGQVVLNIWGDNFPRFLDASAWLELRRSYDDSASALSATPGAIVICDNLSLSLSSNLSSFGNLSCLTEEHLDLGSLGCAEPTLALGWPGGGVLPLKPIALNTTLVRFKQPLIHRVEPPRQPFEVGENMLYELHGFGFGSHKNGAFEVTIGKQRCWEAFRNDTRIICFVDGPLLDSIEEKYPAGVDAICDEHGQVCEGVNISVIVPVNGAFGGVIDNYSTCPTRLGHNQSHQALLKQCDPGYRRQSLQSADCVKCMAGRYQPYVAPVLSCAQCEKGKYSEAGFDLCSTCPAGRYTAVEQSTACTPCPAGSEPANNFTDCELCSVGYYAPRNGTGGCLACEAGSYAPEVGMTACEACAPGTKGVMNQCVPCEFGKFTSVSGSTTCSQCEAGTYTRKEGASSCSSCFWVEVHLTPPERDNRCSLEDTVAHGYFAAAVWCLLCNFLTALLVISTFRRRIPIQDIRKQGKTSVILDTFGPHRLGTLTANHGFPVTLKGTSTTPAGSIDGEYLARIKTGESLELFDRKGGPLSLPFVDTSIGVVTLPFPREFVYTYSLAKFPRVVLLAIFGSASILVARSMQITHMLFSVEIVISVLLAVLTTFLRRSIWAKWSPIYNRIHQYRGILRSENPYPHRCPRGPSRAVQVHMLRELYGFFQAFIQDRNMYYLNENVLLPLTSKARMSFAELAGPKDVDWFVSHYWGTRFKEFV